MKNFGDAVEVRPLEPESFRIIGLALARTNNSVVTRILLDYLRTIAN